jgi:hypothetical protein
MDDSCLIKSCRCGDPELPEQEICFWIFRVAELEAFCNDGCARNRGESADSAVIENQRRRPAYRDWTETKRGALA